METMPPTASFPKTLRTRVTDVGTLVASLKARREKSGSDHQIARRLFVSFERLGMVHTKGLNFYVFDGAVSVYGSVATPEVRDQVISMITGMPGVRQVTEHLQVVNPHKPRKAFSIRPVLFDSL